MGEQTLALRIGQPEIVARELLRAHRNRYRKFWKMADAAVACAMQGRTLSTVFGWHVRPGADPNARSMLNFPMQANGAEMSGWRAASPPNAALKSARPCTTPS